jgi:dipeptidyl aminopeptidase/acylaminoacyl peptidase
MARRVNLTADNPAWDTGPLFAADGKHAVLPRDEAPRLRGRPLAIMAMDLASGARREVAPDWDRSAGAGAVGLTAQLYTTATTRHASAVRGRRRDSGEATHRWSARHVSPAFARRRHAGVPARQPVAGPAQLFVPAPTAAPKRALTRLQPRAPAGRGGFGEFEQFSFKGWNDETVHGYVVKPWNFEEGKKYPVAFLIHGGPQGSDRQWLPLPLEPADLCRRRATPW